MVTFLSLFLGLTVGTHEVRLGVDDRVAEVRLYLDGTLVGVSVEEPWTVACDFGADLLPRELIAVAFDADRRVLGRAEQLVNLPRETAEASLALVGGEEGYTAVDVAWQAADASEPEDVAVYFDGEPLEVDDEGRALLPVHNPMQIHIVSAELVFPRQQRASAELVFGGQYGEEVSTELTAVPLRSSSKGGGRLRAEQLEEWLRVDGGPVRVAAIEEPRAEVVIVRDSASLGSLRQIGREAGSAVRRSQGFRFGQSSGRVGKEGHDSVRFVESRPYLVAAPDGEYVRLFPGTPDVSRFTPSIAWAATHLFVDEEPGQIGEELAAAVAVAGLQAAGSNRARAVVLLRAGTAVGGQLSPETVKAFLRVLRVPFHYWRVEETGADDPWGSPTMVPGIKDMNRAVRQLAKDVKSQFIVWLDGIHLPQRVELVGEGAERLSFAGG